MSVKIWKLLVNCGEGEDTYLHGSEEAARRDLFEFVRDSWDQNDWGDMPLDRDDAISLYFEINDAEQWYSIEGENVELGDDFQDDAVVDLTPEEVRAIVGALAHVSVIKLSGLLEVEAGPLSATIQSAYNKLKD
jgi:hypothetical protein